MVSATAEQEVDAVVDQALKDIDDDHERLEKIRASEKEVAEAEAELADAAAAKKLAQANFDDAVARMRQVIREQGEVLPLFDKDKDAWRNELLSAIVSDNRIINAMSAMSLYSIGELTDFLGDGKHQLSDIKGLGQASIEKLENALTDYWSKNPRPTE